MRTTNITTFIATLASLATVSLADKAWPDNAIKEPTDFQAFYLTDFTDCYAQVIFKRDLNDTKYDYYVFANYDDGKKTLLYIQQDTTQDDAGSEPFAVVNATSGGQRGAYILPGGKQTLVPFSILTCDNGHDGQPKSLQVRAFEAAKNPEGDAERTDYAWQSQPFKLQHTRVPQGSGVQRVEASYVDGNKISVTWELFGAKAEDVQGFFIIAGISEAPHLYSAYVDGGQAKQGFVSIGNRAQGNFAATVVTYGKSGAVNNPTTCIQVATV